MVLFGSYGNDWKMPIASLRHANDPALIALGAAIKAARLERGITQEELAQRAGTDQSYISSIERGGQNPGIVFVLQMVHAMNMTATELFAEAEL